MDWPVHDDFVIRGISENAPLSERRGAGQQSGLIRNIPVIRDLPKEVRHFEGGCEMRQKECVAMVLAGGNGERLGTLTNDTAKPAVYFGGKYRIIDFTLSNCAHSGIGTLGVLTQYRAPELHSYINNGQAWKLNNPDGGVFMLPSSQHKSVYTGTANAVYQNISFIDKFDPEHVLILSGDHIYKMDYTKMLDFHRKTGADATISVVPVPLEEASRFGIISASMDGRITEFAEKPKKPKSNLASMGIYIFKWSSLKRYLTKDRDNSRSAHDFGRNIIPVLLSSNEKMYAYEFNGYWRDVGTVQSLWESNMDLIRDNPLIDLYDEKWEILSRSRHRAPCCMPAEAEAKRNIVAEGCHVHGKVSNSVLFNYVTVCEGAEVIDSVVMPGTFIGKNAKVHKSIIGANAWIGENTEIGADFGLDVFIDNEICSKGISLIGPGVSVDEGIKVGGNSYINTDLRLKSSNWWPISRATTKSELPHVLSLQGQTRIAGQENIG